MIRAYGRRGFLTRKKMRDGVVIGWDIEGPGARGGECYRKVWYHVPSVDKDGKVKNQDVECELKAVRMAELLEDVFVAGLRQGGTRRNLKTPKGKKQAKVENTQSENFEVKGEK